MADIGLRDAALLLDMRLAAEDALTFATGLDETAFLDSHLHQNAIIRSLEIIDEAAGKVSAEVKAAHPEIPWRDITAMRNRLIHGYAEVRPDNVWHVVRHQLEPLIEALSPLIPPPPAL